MLKIYGTVKCPDCVECLGALDKAGTEYSFTEIFESTANMKEFLAYRDNRPEFDEAKANGGIGIPYIIEEDGTTSFSWEKYI